MQNRQENKEVEQYLKGFVSERLEKCKLFIKVFGKGFAKRQLDINSNKLYTNEFSTAYNGYLDIDDNSITLCSEKLDSKLLTIEEVKSNDKIIATAMHEMIHQILMKSLLECKDNDFSYASGLLEIYNNKSEVGRGGNEGLVNWMCEKAGVKTFSYISLTKFIYEIELAIGSRRTMTLAKGNIKDNIAKLFHMKPSECNSFLGIMDKVYYLQSLRSDTDDILDILTNLQANMNSSDISEEEEKSIDEQYLMLDDNEEYQQAINSNEYKEMLLQENRVDNIESRVYFFREKISSFNKDIIAYKTLFKNTLYEKYFRKDFEKLMTMQSVPHRQMERFTRLYELVSTDAVNQDSLIYKFQTEYQTFKNKEISYNFFEKILSKLRGNSKKKLNSSLNEEKDNNDMSHETFTQHLRDLSQYGDVPKTSLNSKIIRDKDIRQL